MTSTDRMKVRRRWRIALLVALIAGAGLFVALPQFLSRSLARRILMTRADRILAPGSLEAGAVRLSWFGPTEIDRAVLRDEGGAPLITAPRAQVDWGLWQILFSPPRTATLEMPGAAVEIHRLPGGQVDLYETLRPIIREEPEIRLIVAIAGGRLQFHDPVLAEPFLAEEADIRLDIAPDPRPVEWDLAFKSHAEVGREPGRIGFKGSVHRPGAGGASVSLSVSRWPWAVGIGGVVTSVELDANLGAERRDARWVISGDANAPSVLAAVTGAPDGSAPRRIGSVHAALEVEGQAGDWTARRLELAIPYARLDGSGTIKGTTASSLVDLKGSLAPDWAAIQADLRRDVEPNARIAGRPREWRLKGAVGGPGSGDRFLGLAGELDIQLDALDIFGMRLGETVVVLRNEGGRLRIDPIDARLNQGALHVEPELVGEVGGPMRVKLGPSSTLQDAVINDEVSHRVLSYAAPVLDGATRVEGRVSVRGLDAEFPLGEGAGKAARVEGNVLFNDVRFLPGPLAEAVIDLLPRLKEEQEAAGGAMLVLRDPISFRIAERKVYTRGLLVPLGQIGTVAMEGSVDFDRRLDLVARFRVNPPRMDRPMLAALLSNAKFALPIKGTLDDPRIDEEALKEQFNSMGSDMLGNSIGAGADVLMRVLQGLPRRREARKPPADVPEAASPRPERPARPTAEERQELREQRRLERQEKKAQRRMKRGLPPE